ncbi:cytochrome c oxidase assembly factor 1 homolog [Liolophura sinensis]|uniref:cytochrome c oxidase assembly factor 1 homolog n=1 Tax=Liolophura sinensis TaxID=3198878 RepID=UPI0031588D1D
MLTKVAIAGGVVALGGAWYFTQRLQNDIKQQDHYKQSVKLLRDYKPAQEAFGKPIIPLSLDLANKDIYMDEKEARLVIPLRGPKDKGTLYTWATREKPGLSWNIDQLDLELKSSGRRWTFYKTNTKPSS